MFIYILSVMFMWNVIFVGNYNHIKQDKHLRKYKKILVQSNIIWQKYKIENISFSKRKLNKYKRFLCIKGLKTIL